MEASPLGSVPSCPFIFVLFPYAFIWFEDAKAVAYRLAYINVRLGSVEDGQVLGGHAEKLDRGESLPVRLPSLLGSDSLACPL
jgi:hypothetical protein